MTINSVALFNLVYSNPLIIGVFILRTFSFSPAFDATIKRFK